MGALGVFCAGLVSREALPSPVGVSTHRLGGHGKGADAANPAGEPGLGETAGAWLSPIQQKE